MRVPAVPAQRDERVRAMLAGVSVPPSETLAYVDDLTGLPNRRFLDRAVDRLIEAGHQFALFFLDLDGFKAVNDTRGHDEGDGVILRFADLLLTSTRGHDLIARYGGDEFVVIVRGGDAATTSAIAARIVAAAAGTLKPLWSVTASLGVARFPEDARSKRTLLAMADKAMYEAKTSGRSCWRRSQPERHSLYWHEDVFVDREHELGWLRAHLDPEAKHAFSIVCGGAGMGKSALMAMAIRHIASRVRVLEITCTPAFSSVPYAALLTALRSGCARWGRPVLPAAWHRVLSAVLPDLFPADEPVRHPFERAVVLHAISSLIQAWGPLAVVVHDAHLLDDDTAVALVYVREARMPEGIALCCSVSDEYLHRRESPFARIAALPGAEVLRLGPLTVESIRELIARRLGREEVPEDLARAVHRASGGLPLIATDAARDLLDSGVLDHADRAPAWRDSLASFSSERVSSMVAHKLAEFSDDERRILAHAAAVDGAFDLELLRSLVSRSDGEILTALDKARRLGLLTSGGADPFAFSFANQVFKEEILRTAEASTRREAHLRMAAHLRSIGDHAARASHLERGGEWHEAMRAHYEASRQSAARLLPQVALHHLSEAERIRQRMPHGSVSSAETESLWRELALFLYHCDFPEESRAVHLKLVDVCEARGDPMAAYSDRFRAAVMLRIAGRHEEALTELNSLAGVASPSEQIRLRFEQADCLARLGRTIEAHGVLRLVRTHLGSSEDADPARWSGYHHARSLVALAEGAFRTAERAARLAARGRSETPEAWWYFNDLAETCLFNGKPLDATGHFATSRRLASMIPSIMGGMWSGLGHALALYRLDRPREALAELDSIEPLSAAAKDKQALFGTRLHRARVLLDLGRIEEAAAATDWARAEGNVGPAIDYVSSFVERARGNLDDALRLARAAREAEGVATPLQLMSSVLVTLDDVEIQHEALLAAHGDTSGVRARLSPRVRSFPPTARLAALGLLAECAHREGDDDEAGSLYRQALGSKEGRQEVRARRLLYEAWASWSREAEGFKRWVDLPRGRRDPARAP